MDGTGTHNIITQPRNAKVNRALTPPRPRSRDGLGSSYFFLKEDINIFLMSEEPGYRRNVLNNADDYILIEVSSLIYYKTHSIEGSGGR